MKNRYLAAFQDPVNVLGLAGVGALALAAMGPLTLPILLAGAVVEAAYLIFVPDTKWFDRRLGAQHDKEIYEHRAALKAQVFPILSPELQARFERMVGGRDEVARQRDASQTKTGEKWVDQIVRKLDFLLEKWLQFAQKEAQFRDYIENLSREHGVKVRSFSSGVGSAIYENELRQMERQWENETDPSTKAILEKRLEVVRRRAEFAEKIVKTVDNLNHQLELLEDTFALVREEMLARSPEQVLGDIDDVVSQTNAMAQVLEEIAPYERMLAE